MQTALEDKIRTFPEVDQVFAKIGTADVATDPVPPSVADTFVIMKPREGWPDPRKPKEQLVAEMNEAVQQVPGSRYEFLQPIQMRFNELIAGVRSDVAIKIFGDDLDQLASVAAEVEGVVSSIEGSQDAQTEQVTGLPFIQVIPDRIRLTQLGLNVDDVQTVVSTAMERLTGHTGHGHGHHQYERERAAAEAAAAGVAVHAHRCAVWPGSIGALAGATYRASRLCIARAAALSDSLLSMDAPTPRVRRGVNTHLAAGKRGGCRARALRDHVPRTWRGKTLEVERVL